MFSIDPDGTLRISLLKAEENLDVSGEYTCLASNGYSDDIASAFLTLAAGRSLCVKKQRKKVRVEREEKQRIEKEKE